jgi:hypothetical protein
LFISLKDAVSLCGGIAITKLPSPCTSNTFGIWSIELALKLQRRYIPTINNTAAKTIASYLTGCAGCAGR